MNAPHYPPFGLHLPCRLSRVIDGDTVAVSLADSQREWKIRLIDCWAPERKTPAGRRAAETAKDLLEAADQLSVFIPSPKNTSNLLANLTFDRIPGWVYLREDRTLNEAMIDAGCASSTKHGKRGE